MNRKRISFTIPALEPKPAATIHWKWLSPAWNQKFTLHIAYLDRLSK